MPVGARHVAAGADDGLPLGGEPVIAIDRLGEALHLPSELVHRDFGLVKFVGQPAPLVIVEDEGVMIVRIAHEIAVDVAEALGLLGDRDRAAAGLVHHVADPEAEQVAVEIQPLGHPDEVGSEMA